MARYKDIDAIIEKMQGSTAETWGKGLGRSWWSHSVMLKDNIVQLMKDAPEADVVEVRHGRWVHTDYAMHWHGKDECSECTYHTSDRDDLSHLKYCPNCGARMDGDEDEL